MADLPPPSSRVSAVIRSLERRWRHGVPLPANLPMKIVAQTSPSPLDVFAAPWIAAAANHAAPPVLLLVTAGDGAELAGWPGEDVSAAVEKWSRGRPSNVYKRWRLSPPLALLDDIAAAAPVDRLSMVAHVLDARMLQLVPGVRDTLIRDTQARYVLLLDVRPSSALVLFENALSTPKAGMAAVVKALALSSDTGTSVTTPRENVARSSWRRAAHAAAMELEPGGVRHRVQSALDFAQLCNNTRGASGTAASWRILPKMYDARHLFSSELAACDWKATCAWLDNSALEGSTYEAQQDAAVLSTAYDYAAALLNLPGGGELIFGVWDRHPNAGGIEGLVSAPAQAGSQPYDELGRRLRAALQRALTPWYDDWLRVTPVEVCITRAGLMTAADVRGDRDDLLAGVDGEEVLTVSFKSYPALVAFRQLLRTGAPCASLPLPLLEDGRMPASMAGAPVVLRVPESDASKSALVDALRKGWVSGNITVASAAWSYVRPRLPLVHVLHVELRAFHAHATGAICTRFDVAAPALVEQEDEQGHASRGDAWELHYLAWDDIASRLAWDPATQGAHFLTQLASPARTVLCWNVSLSPASSSLFSALQRQLVGSRCTFDAVATRDPGDWAAAALLRQESTLGALDLVIVCAGRASQPVLDAVRAAFAAPAGSASELLAVARDSRVWVIADSNESARALLSAADTNAGISHVLKRATYVPLLTAHFVCGGVSAATTPPGDPVRLSEVHEAALGFLRGEPLQPETLLQVLRLPREERVDFTRHQQPAVRALVNEAVYKARTRGGHRHVVLSRQHAAAGAATVALRALVDAGLEPLLLDELTRDRVDVLTRWTARATAQGTVMAAVLRSHSIASQLSSDDSTDWMGAVLGGRPAVLVHIVDVAASAASPAGVRPLEVTGQLATDEELADAVRVYTAALPSRALALGSFFGFASQLDGGHFQRSVTALAVAGNMDKFVPINIVLSHFLPRADFDALSSSPRSGAADALADLPASGVWLLRCAVFHAFRIRGTGTSPRFGSQLVRAMRDSRAWHLVGHSPGNSLPWTVHEGFSAAVLHRAAALLPEGSSRRTRVLDVVQHTLVGLVGVSGDAAGEQSAWFAALQSRDGTSRFSNIVSTAYHAHGARRAVQLVNAVRKALAVQTATSGAHLLVTAARIYRCAAKESSPNAFGFLQRAMQYALLALQCWDNESACTAEVGAGAEGISAVRSALQLAPTSATIARHCLAGIAGHYGVHLSYQAEERVSWGPEPQQWVALALTTLWQLRTEGSLPLNTRWTEDGDLGLVRNFVGKLEQSYFTRVHRVTEYSSALSPWQPYLKPALEVDSVATGSPSDRLDAERRFVSLLRETAAASPRAMGDASGGGGGAGATPDHVDW